MTGAGWLVAWALGGLPAAGDPVLTLPQLFTHAALSKEEIRQAREDLAQAELMPWRALARVAPQFSVSAAFMKQRELFQTGLPSPVVPGDQQQYTAGFKWPIGNLEFLPRRSQGEALINAKRARLDAVLQGTLQEVATSYFGVLKAQALVRLAEQFDRQARDHQFVAKKKFEEGAVRKTVLLEADLEVIRAAKRLTEYRNALIVSKEELCHASGTTLDAFDVEEPPATTLPPGLAPDTPLPELVRLAHAHRPELLVADLEVRYAWAERDAAFTRILPTLGFEGGYVLTDPQTAFSQREQWRLSAVLTVPLFQGGEEWLAQQEKASLARQTELVRDALKKRIELDVKRAYYAWQVLVKNLDVLAKQVEISREHLRMTENQFQESMASGTDVTDARAALLNAEIELARERYDARLAYLVLLRMLGLLSV